MKAWPSNTTRRFRLRCFVSSEQGTHLVEMALVLPIVILLFAVVAEFGHFFYTYTTLAKGTRAGARYLITKPWGGSDGATSIAAAQKLVICGELGGDADCAASESIVNGLTTANIDITSTGGTLTHPQTVTVRVVNFKYQPLFDLGRMTGIDALSLRIDISPATTMRYLLT